jgi:thiol-disulfide isomerase/thioredoxin
MAEHLENVPYLELLDFNSDGSLKPGVGAGKQVILMVQASFCGYCKQAMPAYQQFADKANSDTNSDFVCVTLQSDAADNEKEASKYIKMVDSSYMGVPTYLMYDENGKYLKTNALGRDVASLEKFSFR